MTVRTADRLLLDANILLYAVDRASPHHGVAAAWLQSALNGTRRIAFPWQSIGAFLRIATHPRASDRPLTGTEAWSFVQDWLATDVAWIPSVGDRTAVLLGELIQQHHLTGNLITDAQLAALAIEHGLTIASADTDFARFGEVQWVNPLA